MRYDLNLITAPVAEPLTLAEAKAHLRVTSDDDNDYITALIQAVREQAEAYTSRAFVKQVWELSLDAFPASSASAVRIQKPPLISVDSVKYLDADGVEQTWDAANYQVASDLCTTRLLPGPGETWPTVEASRLGAATIQFTAGYPGDGNSPESFTANVPQAAKQAMLLMLGTAYAHRETVVTGTIATALPQSAEWLLDPLRVVTV